MLRLHDSLTSDNKQFLIYDNGAHRKNFFLTLNYNKILCAIKKPLVAKLNWIRPKKNKLSQLKYICAKNKIEPKKKY